MKTWSEQRDKLTKVMSRLDSSFYFYNLDHLKSHLQSIAGVIDEDVKLWYACKANPYSGILKIFRNLGFGIDVASKGELDQVISSGVTADHVIATGPSKSKKYFKELLENEVEVIVLESLNQAYWLDEAAASMNKRPQVLLRVQLAWEGGSSVLGGDAITPFGIEDTSWLELDRNRTNHLDFIGFHVFQWGNLMELDRLKTIWWHIGKTLSELSKKLNIPLNVVDLGGGLGVPYDFHGSMLEFNQVNELLREFKAEFKPQKIWMELGRYTVAGCGTYFTQVIDRKSVRGKEILVTDGGINHIARPALTGQPFPCSLFRQSSAIESAFQVHGPLCTALDVLGSFELPNDIAPGDWLAFSMAGAYGFTEAMPFFLCHNLPAEVTYYNGDLMTPRPVRSSADWLV
ncbi:MAG: diaminopimelate decarboxylase [Bdellovibrionales bacterium CG12_big_fil_rev_8_21_14_0_65_38_15]|nr:MAG: diaminopimelate decarboxylase [Bdellovibrionales bacterium CG22_combo_CG10-13_8_21_14_all_38_13]PIQ54262.1 MAG: diaminopimelate decarboxylase [Bdellovibrionales bacterium CG12_big_fil_rev_8_21_14_0_65_38_15]PIR29318.1 MAG: diaminopimelate decarboxylase [Bdellovibrionales bacterium CG11_big_fil_rev_8_21_14_0_20_38_13]